MSKSDERSVDERTVWARRFSGLLEIVREVEKEVEAVEPEDIQGPDEWPEVVPTEDFWMTLIYGSKYFDRQIETCRHLLQRLKSFAKQAADILGKSDGSTGGYSLRHLWRTLLHEVSTDLQIIQAAIRQRNPMEDWQADHEASGEEHRSSLVYPQAGTLFMADIVAEHALEQAVESGFLNQTPIITYLRENVSMRPVPYAQVVLAGVAHATMLETFDRSEAEISYRRVSRDLLAIPHEIGHHLFWQGQVPGKRRSVQEQLERRLKRAEIWEWDWRRAWLEEIVADAFGCLVAGPVMALSFQDLLTDGPPDHLTEDTGHHPIPVLRPYVQTRILRSITDADGTRLYTSAPGLLDSLWRQGLAATFGQTWAGIDPLELAYELHGLARPVKGRLILKALDRVIQIVVRTLRGRRPSHRRKNWTHGSWHAWTTDVKDMQALLGLYDRLSFEQFGLKGRWLDQPDFGDLEVAPEALPAQILSGWSVEGPEHSGKG